MIGFFEGIVVKQAEYKIKHKRLFAWLLFVSALLTFIKICIKLHKMWDEHFKWGVADLKRKMRERKQNASTKPEDA